LRITVIKLFGEYITYDQIWSCGGKENIGPKDPKNGLNEKTPQKLEKNQTWSCGGKKRLVPKTPQNLGKNQTWSCGGNRKDWSEPKKSSERKDPSKIAIDPLKN